MVSPSKILASSASHIERMRAMPAGSNGLSLPSGRHSKRSSCRRVRSMYLSKSPCVVPYSENWSRSNICASVGCVFSLFMVCGLPNIAAMRWQRIMPKQAASAKRINVSSGRACDAVVVFLHSVCGGRDTSISGVGTNILHLLVEVPLAARFPLGYAQETCLSGWILLLLVVLTALSTLDTDCLPRC